MIRLSRNWIFGSAPLGALLWAPTAPVLAQEADDSESSPRGRGAIEIAPMPDWSIRQEVDRLDTSMKEYSSLIKSLTSASDELSRLRDT